MFLFFLQKVRLLRRQTEAHEKLRQLPLQRGSQQATKQRIRSVQRKRDRFVRVAVLEAFNLLLTRSFFCS